MNIDEKIIARFQELINFESELIKTRKVGGGEEFLNARGQRVRKSRFGYVNYEMAHQWGISCLHTFKRVFGENNDHYLKFNALFPHFPQTQNFSTIKLALGILKAAKDDFENDGLFQTRILIEAEVFDDFLEQAEHLLKNGYYAPAAVIAGSVLEDGLRKLCERKNVSVSTKATIEPMNVELAKAGVYNTLVQKRVTALADIRNKAAHGKWGEFNDNDVGQMIVQVKTFMEGYFS